MAYNSSLVSEVLQLRSQGLPDAMLVNELTQRGYLPEQVQQALSQADAPAYPEYPPEYAASPPASTAPKDDLYERIEEIAETIIDEKWDELIAEVKKVVEWKAKIEEKEGRIQGDLEQLKQNFTLLHQGVLGKLEDYDARMQDVGTELKAVGKVFKDVIPEFVENVKELSETTRKLKKK